MHDEYDSDVANILVKSENNTTRGHNFKLFKKRPRLNVRKYSFCYRVVDLWNRLLKEVVEATSVFSFERRLDKLFRDQPIRFNYRETVKLHGSFHESDMEENEELVL